MFINDALISLIIDLPSNAVIDATPLNQVDSTHARTAVVITFDSVQTRDRILRKAQEREADNSIPKAQKYYFTEMPKRSHPRLQTHTDYEVQDMWEEERDKMRRKITAREKAKIRQKAKSVATQTVDKVNKKYLRLNSA